MEKLKSKSLRESKFWNLFETLYFGLSTALSYGGGGGGEGGGWTIHLVFFLHYTIMV